MCNIIDINKKCIILSLLLIVLLTISCDNHKKDNDILTQQDAMSFFINNSPERGAIFYNKNRKKYPFLDKLYRDSIYPAITNCNYYELKNIYYTLKDTQFEKDIKILMVNSKGTLLKSISEELNQNMLLEQKIFKEEYMPIIEIGLDSIIHNDIEKIINEYAGGFLNHKKLYFFIGKNSEDFKELWRKNIVYSRYLNYIQVMTTNYLNIISSNKREYLNNVTGRNITQKFELQIQPETINISENIVNYVKEFTHSEKMEMMKDAIKDWIAPMAIGLLTGGTGAALYEMGITGYDIKVTIDDIKKQKLDSNDALMYMCEDDIHTQIKDKCLDSYTKQVMNKIQDINQQTYKLIDFAL